LPLRSASWRLHVPSPVYAETPLKAAAKVMVANFIVVALVKLGGVHNIMRRARRKRRGTKKRVVSTCGDFLGTQTALSLASARVPLLPPFAAELARNGVWVIARASAGGRRGLSLHTRGWKITRERRGRKFCVVEALFPNKGRYGAGGGPKGVEGGAGEGNAHPAAAQQPLTPPPRPRPTCVVAQRGGEVTGPPSPHQGTHSSRLWRLRLCRVQMSYNRK